jgi:hypothetical protein
MIQALLLLYEYEKNGEFADSRNREDMVTEKILGQDIKLLLAGIIATKAKPAGNVEELFSIWTAGWGYADKEGASPIAYRNLNDPNDAGYPRIMNHYNQQHLRAYS